MSLDNLTLKEIKELITFFGQNQKPQPASSDFIGSYVIIRTYSAGVHFGKLIKHEGTEVELKEAKRIWSWKGANTLHEMALHGISPESRVSEALPFIILTQAIEIIPCTGKSSACLLGAAWGK